MVLAQAALETRMLLRNGEQLLLTVIIPTLLLVLFSKVDVVNTGPGERVDFLAPGILALAVMSTAFTGQAIATGFERRYGVLKRLAVSPLPRWALLLGKTLCVLAVEALQVALLATVAFALGWSPHGRGTAIAVLLLLAGTVAFSGLGLLMAGTLRAEATLAAANLVYLLLLVCGGIVVPLSRFGGAAHVLRATPTAALANGLRAALAHGATPWRDVLVLVAWAVVGTGLAARTFRWE
jgi:ABC-2 type transport system permease protein